MKRNKYGSYCLLPIYGYVNGRGMVDCTLLDNEDAIALEDISWGRNLHGYVASQTRPHKGVLLHRLILGLEKGDPRNGHHKNGDIRDNRRSNLEILSHSDHGRQSALSTRIRSPRRPAAEALEAERVARIRELFGPKAAA